MTTNSYFRMMLLTLCLIIGGLSCTVENTSTLSPTYPENVTVEVGVYSIGIIGDKSDNLSIRIEDEEIASAVISENTLTVQGKKVGRTLLSVSDKEQNHMFTINIEVVKSERLCKILKFDTKIEIINEDYKPMIENEIVNDFPFTVGAIYKLTYSQLDKGDLIIYPKENNKDEFITGTFTQAEKDTIVFNYSNKQETYTVKYQLVSSSTDINKQTLTMHLIKDYTAYLRAKYPEAGVYRVQNIQIVESNW